MKQLSHYSNKYTDDWNKFLPHALFAYRVTPQTSTKTSPFEILFGRIARSPLLNGLINPDDLHLDPDSYAAEISSRFLAAYDIVKSHIKGAQQAMAKHYNAKRRDFSYGIGDLVWVKIHKPKGTPKLSPRWKGPFIITKRTSDLNYVVKDLAGGKRFTTNVNHIKPYASRSEISDQQIPENSTTDDEFSKGGEELPQDSTQHAQTLTPEPTVSQQAIAGSEMIPDPQLRRSTRRSTKDNSLVDLANLLMDIRQRFEELPHYEIKAVKRQLSELLTRGSALVTSDTLNKKFKTQISQLKNRPDVLFFLQRITSHFNAEFAEQIYS
jgi:hypothetical protein